MLTLSRLSLSTDTGRAFAPKRGHSKGLHVRAANVLNMNNATHRHHLVSEAEPLEKGLPAGIVVKISQHGRYFRHPEPGIALCVRAF